MNAIFGQKRGTRISKQRWSVNACIYQSRLKKWTLWTLWTVWTNPSIEKDIIQTPVF